MNKMAKHKKIVFEILKKIKKNIAFKNRHQLIFAKYHKFTMVPEMVFCDNLSLAEKFAGKVIGDVVECGVWKGGMIAGLTEVMGKNRSYFLFDSFEGLPQAQKIDGISALNWQSNLEGGTYYNNCTAEEGFANEVMQQTKAKYFLKKGWFNISLPAFECKNPIALLRLDADWYDSTLDCFKHIYPLVNKNGLIIIDDYYTWDGLQGCS